MYGRTIKFKLCVLQTWNILTLCKYMSTGSNRINRQKTNRSKTNQAYLIVMRVFIFIQIKRYLNVQVYLSMFTMFKYIYRYLPHSVHWRYYQFAIDILHPFNSYAVEYLNKMIDQIIFRWKLHSGDWKSMRHIIKEYLGQLWRRVSTITSFDDYVGNVTGRLILF
jgi:hypothetical protein